MEVEKGEERGESETKGYIKRWGQYRVLSLSDVAVDTTLIGRCSRKALGNKADRELVSSAWLNLALSIPIIYVLFYPVSHQRFQISNEA